MDSTLAPAFDGVENVVLTDLFGMTVDNTNVIFPDVTSLTLKNSTLASTVNNIAYATTTVTMAGTTGNVTLSGTGTTASVKANAGVDAALDVATATTLNLELTGDATLTDIADRALTTLTVTGTGNFTLDALSEEGLTTINTSGLTGNADISGVNVDAAAGDRTVTLGAGNDRLALVGALDDATNNTTFTGGEGTDTLSIDTNIVDASGTTGFEVIELASNLTFAADSIDGLTGIVAAGAADNDVGEITDYTSGVALTLSDRNASATTDTLAIDVTGADDSLSGTADAITIAIDATQEDDTNAFTVDRITVTADNNGDVFETLNLNIGGVRAVTISDFDSNGAGAALEQTTININSSVDLTVTTMQLASGEDNTVDFSDSTGTITATIETADLESGDVVIGGSGTEDVLNLAANNVTVDAEISGFETINFNGTGATAVFSLADVTAATIGVDAGATTNITNAASGQDFEIVNGGAAATLNINAASASSSIDLALGNNVTDTTIQTGANVTSVTIANTEAAQTAALWDLDAAVTTLAITGDENITLAAASDIDSVKTLNLSGFNAGFVMDSSDSLAAAATVTFSAEADDSTIVIDGTNAAVDRFVFGSDIATGVQIDITGFNAGFANGDVLNLSALGVTGIADLTVVYADGGDGDGNGNETLTITSVDADADGTGDFFDGTIVLTGTYINTADLQASNFVFA